MKRVLFIVILALSGCGKPFKVDIDDVVVTHKLDVGSILVAMQGYCEDRYLLEVEIDECYTDLSERITSLINKK